jgi:hypothetical protein
MLQGSRGFFVRCVCTVCTKPFMALREHKLQLGRHWSVNRLQHYYTGTVIRAVRQALSRGHASTAHAGVP